MAARKLMNAIHFQQISYIRIHYLYNVPTSEKTWDSGNSAPMNAVHFLQFPSLPPTQISKPIPILSIPSNVKSLRYPILSIPPSAKTNSAIADDDACGIPANQVKILAKFKSLHNQIRVLEVSRRADHPLAGSRLLLLDRPGNIHSISFLLQPFTSTYFDVFATLPPILPPGPIAILGFGAGSAARLLLHLHPNLEIHGWELDHAVIAVAREFFGLTKLEQQYRGNLFIHIGDALAEPAVGHEFAGILVDLFQKGSVVPELQDLETWGRLKRRLRRGGRVMVNCGGKCVEAEESRRDGEAVMKETVRAMSLGFGADQVFVEMLGYGEGDGCVAMTGRWPLDPVAWKRGLPKPLRAYVDSWRAFDG
ncbi:hypothetical protein AXF42_Ash004910 [Apostasia shenzhenica]|uniref:Spermidine synthase n=1 Tax=Apostasia shenzhenica TaxID=1088818 RepID=A0A2I0B7Z0_9ASPA|nr:hypothetical protein AXF42_Ash004910 [Apostasia shenzhenica]